MATNITAGIRELLSDLRSPKLIAALIQGVVIGVLVVVVQMSFANIIFSGQLAPLAMRASGLCIFGAAGLSLVTGLFSSYRTLVSDPADTTVAILSIIAAAIVATIPTASLETLFATVVAAMVSSALLTALFFWLIGKFKISNIARFIPYPVIGGFLAGSGVMLIFGSFGVMAGRSLSLATIPELMTLEMFVHWAPGVVFALCVFAIMKVKSHFLVLPISIFTGIVLFFLVVYSLGASFDQLRIDGWLPAEMPAGQLWPSITIATTQMVDWPTFFMQLPNILTICLMSLIGMILNINGIELGSHQDIDLDRELKVEAFGNLLCGLGGGSSGYATLSMSLLGPNSGTSSRVIPISSALVCLGVVFAGGEVLNYMPKPVLGGVLFLVGFFFLDEWIFSGWKRLTIFDYLIVVSIVLTIINQGFLLGIVFGLVLTTIIFLVRFTRIPVIQRSETLATQHSMQQRSVPDRVFLDGTGHECIVLTISGYLFFGSTYFVGGKVKELFDQETNLDSLILDLTQVQGFDISAMNTLQRIAQQSLSRDIRIVLAASPAGLMKLIQRNATAEAIQQFDFCNDLDTALELSEEHLLSQHRDVLNDNSADSLEARDNLFAAAVDDLDAQLQEQERFEVLLEKMDPYLVQRTLVDEEVLFQQGQAQTSIVFIIWGTISLWLSDEGHQQRKLASLGSGKIIASKVAWGDWAADYTAKAEQQAMVATMSTDAVHTMEIEVPEVALAMYKHMAEDFVNENEKSKKHGR